MDPDFCGWSSEFCGFVEVLSNLTSWKFSFLYRNPEKRLIGSAEPSNVDLLNFRLFFLKPFTQFGWYYWRYCILVKTFSFGINSKIVTATWHQASRPELPTWNEYRKNGLAWTRNLSGKFDHILLSTWPRPEFLSCHKHQ